MGPLFAVSLGAAVAASPQRLLKGVLQPAHTQTHLLRLSHVQPANTHTHTHKCYPTVNMKKREKETSTPAVTVILHIDEM